MGKIIQLIRLSESDLERKSIITLAAMEYIELLKNSNL